MLRHRADPGGSPSFLLTPACAECPATRLAMTERELANHVLEAVDRVAYRNAAHHVSRVRIAVGGRRHFDFELLDRTFAAAARGTVADGATLLVKLLPVTRHCLGCGATFEGAAHDLG